MPINRLFLCEKPSLGKLIAPKIGASTPRQGYIQISNGDVVTWSAGHAYELADTKYYDPSFEWSKANIPFIPPQFVILPKKGMAEQLKTIKTLLKDTKVVVSVGDPDREGNLLIDEILEELKWKGVTQRIFIYGQDDKSVIKAISDIKNNSDYACWTEAARLRSRIDWLAGINHTVALTVFARTVGFSSLLTVGRVQTPLLNMIVTRYRENKNFKPKTFFSLKAQFDKDHIEFTGSLQTQGIDNPEVDSEGRIVGKSLATTITDACFEKSGLVVDVERKKSQDPAPLPFCLNTLQEHANKTWMLEPTQTLAAVQKLYDQGYTTYPRTGCEYIPEAQFSEASEILSALKRYHRVEIADMASNADLSIKSRAFNDKKIDAHFALIPTGKIPEPNSISDSLTEIYCAIVQRYILQFYPPEIFETQSITIDLSGYYWKSNGRRTLSPGWKAVIKSHSDEDDCELPVINKGDTAICKKISLEEKQTTPPPLFTPGSIITAMEEAHKFVTDAQQKATLRGIEGLGTVATRANIYEGLKRREYIVVQKNKIFPTPLGEQLIDLVSPEMKSIGMTAQLENRLEQVLKGEADPAPILKEYETSLKPAIDALFRSEPKLSVPIEIHKCPECQCNLTRITSKKTGKKYWVCTSETCKFIAPDKDGKPGPQKPKAEVHPETPCPKCGKPLARHDGKFGPWWGCTGYSNGCDYSAADDNGKPGLPREKIKAAGEFNCPECGQKLKYIKSSKTGEYWHICENKKKHQSKKPNFFPDSNGSPVFP